MSYARTLALQMLHSYENFLRLAGVVVTGFDDIAPGLDVDELGDELLEDEDSSSFDGLE